MSTKSILIIVFVLVTDILLKSVSVNPQDNKCKILDWYGSTEIVADRNIISSDPKDLVRHVPLGLNAMKVGIDFARQPNAFLWKLTSDMSSIEDVVGNIVA
ncbi:hypothetical protein PanWU01x14_156770 [Parasponia andersonii]|uniref:Uncharacterized protein n=1 Tax=Parasponia andersonii TaxID=3476 RepID=A0A2P5CFG6_PARAD|nr:hypothetical protein PanWU01x14_156770 [Parasponia andersonii]